MRVKFAFWASLVALFLIFMPLAKAEISGTPAKTDLTNPAQFLAKYPSGGERLAAEVQTLLSSDKSNLPLIIGLLSSANGDQQNALADGLARAAKLYLKTDPACAINAPAAPVCFATQIQQAVANSNDPNFIKSYASMAGDTGTASTGGGGGGGGGGGPTAVGPQTGGTNTGSSGGGNNGVNTNSAGLSTISVSGASSSQVSPF